MMYVIAFFMNIFNQKRLHLFNNNVSYAKRHGFFGEALCAHILLCKGYKIIEKNYKVSGGEVDIICIKGCDLVFVEVKTWERFAESDLSNSVDQRKLSRIRTCADIYIAQSLYTRMCIRFDVMLLNISHRVIIHYKGVW